MAALRRCSHCIVIWQNRFCDCFGCIFDYFETCFDKTLRITGPAYVIAAWVLIMMVICVFFLVLLPICYDITTPIGALHATVGAVLSFNILFNYIKCIRTDPGHPPCGMASMEEGGLGSLPKARWCKKCCGPKPWLTHHCSVCKKCVLKMDHHCPWMNNCVGLRNYRFFFLFLFWLWCGCAYSSFMVYPAVQDDAEIRWIRFQLRVGDFRVPYTRNRVMSADEESVTVFCFVLTSAVFIAISMLLFWHVYLTMTLQTTIEFHANRDARRSARRRGEKWVNELDLGPGRNWREVFDEHGRFWWVMWVLPRLRLHGGSGMTWPTRRGEAALRGARALISSI